MGVVVAWDAGTETGFCDNSEEDSGEVLDDGVKRDFGIGLGAFFLREAIARLNLVNIFKS